MARFWKTGVLAAVLGSGLPALQICAQLFRKPLCALRRSFHRLGPWFLCVAHCFCPQTPSAAGTMRFASGSNALFIGYCRWCIGSRFGVAHQHLPGAAACGSVRPLFDAWRAAADTVAAALSLESLHASQRAAAVAQW